MSVIDVKAFEKILKERLEELNTRLHGIEDQLDETPNSDAEERAVEREGDEVLESLGQAGLQEISMIEAALKRIEEGKYGICVSCEEPISEERLTTLPHTSMCRNCA